MDAVERQVEAYNAGGLDAFMGQRRRDDDRARGRKLRRLRRLARADELGSLSAGRQAAPLTLLVMGRGTLTQATAASLHQLGGGGEWPAFGAARKRPAGRPGGRPASSIGQRFAVVASLGSRIDVLRVVFAVGVAAVATV